MSLEVLINGQLAVLFFKDLSVGQVSNVCIPRRMSLKNGEVTPEKIKCLWMTSVLLEYMYKADM